MENNQSFNELEQMRLQMEEFKAQLHNQKIVNEKLIISSMKSGMSWIKKYVIFEICIIPIVALMWLVIKEAAGLSWYSYCTLILFMIADVVFDYRINVSAMSDADYNHNNLVTTATKLVRMKTLRYKGMLVSLPLTVALFVWMFIEAVMNFNANGSDFMLGAYYGGLLGGVIGLPLGLGFAFHIYSKMQKTNNEIISQINELTTP